MPHIDLYHYPCPLDGDARDRLAQDLVDLIARHLGTEPGAVSIACHPVAPQDWMQDVVGPRIRAAGFALIRQPSYLADESGAGEA